MESNAVSADLQVLQYSVGGFFLGLMCGICGSIGWPIEPKPSDVEGVFHPTLPEVYLQALKNLTEVDRRFSQIIHDLEQNRDAVSNIVVKTDKRLTDLDERVVKFETKVNHSVELLQDKTLLAEQLFNESIFRLQNMTNKILTSSTAVQTTMESVGRDARDLKKGIHWRVQNVYSHSRQVTERMGQRVEEVEVKAQDVLGTIQTIVSNVSTQSGYRRNKTRPGGWQDLMQDAVTVSVVGAVAVIFLLSWAHLVFLPTLVNRITGAVSPRQKPNDGVGTGSHIDLPCPTGSLLTTTTRADMCVVTFSPEALNQGLNMLKEILGHGWEKSLNTKTFVLLSAEQIPTMPPSRAYITFIEHDSRSLILEDMDNSVGIKKKNTVLAMRERRGDVLLVYMDEDDHFSPKPEDALYNSAFKRPMRHELLRQMVAEDKFFTLRKGQWNKAQRQRLQRWWSGFQSVT